MDSRLSYRVTIVERELCRLNTLVGKLLAEKSNRAEEPNGQNTLPPPRQLFPTEPNGGQIGHHPAAIEPSLMEPSAIEPSVIQAGQLRKPIGQHQRVTVPQRVTLHLEMNQETGLSDSTGLIIIPDSFDAALESLSAYGDVNLEVILKNLRKDPGFEGLHRWQPANEVLREARIQIIRWILHPRNIHKFKDNNSIRTTRETSALGQLFREVFPRYVGAKKGRSLKMVFRSSFMNRGSVLAAFLSAVVKVHMQYCSACV